MLCLDVLEHIEDDVSALKEMCRVTKPGGKFLFSVPEDPKLWSDHDESVSHVRRYLRKDFENIEEAYRWAVNNLGIDKYEAEKLMIIGGKRAWEER